MGFARVGHKHNSFSCVICLLVSIYLYLEPFAILFSCKLIPMWCDELCLCVVMRQWNLYGIMDFSLVMVEVLSFKYGMI